MNTVPGSQAGLQQFPGLSSFFGNSPFTGQPTANSPGASKTPQANPFTGFGQPQQAGTFPAPQQDSLRKLLASDKLANGPMFQGR